MLFSQEEVVIRTGLVFLFLVLFPDGWNFSRLLRKSDVSLKIQYWLPELIKEPALTVFDEIWEFLRF